MTTEFFRKYIDIIIENSDDPVAVKNDNERYKFTEAMGHIRHQIVQLYKQFLYPNANPQDLKSGLSKLSQAMESALMPYNMKAGLWASQPEKELRLINDPSLNGLIRNLPYYYEAIDKNNLELVKKALVAAEESLLEITNSIIKSTGNNDQYQSFFQGRL